MTTVSPVTYLCGHEFTSENTCMENGHKKCLICVRARRSATYRLRTGAKQRVYQTLNIYIDAHLTRNRAHWLWAGPRRTDGSSICYFGGKKHQIARELWEAKHGSLKGRRLYRICDVHCCVRPDCHEARQHGWHISCKGAPRGTRGNAKPKSPKHYIYGMTPERAAIYGLIDDEQYLGLYGLRRQPRTKRERQC